MVGLIFAWASEPMATPKERKVVSSLDWAVMCCVSGWKRTMVQVSYGCSLRTPLRTNQSLDIGPSVAWAAKHLGTVNVEEMQRLCSTSASQAVVLLNQSWAQTPASLCTWFLGQLLWASRLWEFLHDSENQLNGLSKGHCLGMEEGLNKTLILPLANGDLWHTCLQTGSVSFSVEWGHLHCWPQWAVGSP